MTLQTNLDAAAVEAAVRRAKEIAGAALLDEAQAVAPVVTGAFKRSGFVDVDGDEVRVGFDVDYAGYVGAEDRMLEKVTERFAPQMAQIVAEELRRSLGR